MQYLDADISERHFRMKCLDADNVFTNYRMNIMMKNRLLTICCLLVMTMNLMAQKSIEENFRFVPIEAKPIMIWQWMDGLVTAEGITADLEAYKEAGIGGVQQFLVGGPVQVDVCDSTNAVGTDSWRSLMLHAIRECDRLGLSFGTHNCPGWSSSAFPTVTPEYSMQRLVWTDTIVNVGKRMDKILLHRPDVDSIYNYYRDIAVIIMPVLDTVAHNSIIVRRDSIVGSLPKGKWRIFRFGHTTNGRTNYATAPTGGVGLECDKMSREAVRRYWEGYPMQLIKLAGDLTGKTFQRMEIDSYEAGGQEWTRLMPEEFKTRKGYDLLPWIPALMGLVVIDSPEATQKVKRDWQETVSDLFAENYYGYMSQLAHDNGLRLLVQPYGTGASKPFNPINTGKVVRQLAPDDPICAEFWAKPDRWGWKDIPRVVNAARGAGHEEIWAEGFTCWPLHAWQDDPAALKVIADRSFCLGINRLMLHAAAQNPWPHVKPGMTFGIWGTWWTPGQTWWKDGAPALFSYIARCQSLLQRGKYVANFNSKNPTLQADAEHIQWIHRSEDVTDIYFITNAMDSACITTITVGGLGKLPEIFDPETGESVVAEVWKVVDGKTQIKMKLMPRQSLFLVLKSATDKQSSGKDDFSHVSTERMPIDGGWTVKFSDDKEVYLPSLVPWNESADNDIKYFSGTARYMCDLNIKKIRKEHRYILDLGDVKNLAVVRVNGIVCGTLWHSPFTIDITEALHKGQNTIEIDVTNLWVNRMVGDEFEPDDVEWSEPKRFGDAPNSPIVGRSMKRVPDWLKNALPRPSKNRKAVVSFKYFNKDTPLLPSGMMGPVQLLIQKAE